MRIVQRLFQLKAPRWAFPLGLASVAMAGYLVTLPTTISFEDSAEFVASAVTLGIPHPSGYPLYVLLAHFFTYVPIGTLPWRVALFSAVCASVALGVLFVIARRLFEGRSGEEPADVSTEALLSVPLAVLSFSSIWWSQAVYAKVYPLHALLLALVLLFVMRWHERQKRTDLFLTAFVFGLACANHLFLAVLLAPFLLAALLVATPRPWKWRQVGLAAAGGVAGLLPYAYIYLRMPSAPYATAVFEGFSGFMRFVARSGYGDVGTEGVNKFGLIASCGQLLFDECGPVMLALALIGAMTLLRGKKKHPAAAFLLGGLLGTPVFIVLFRSFGYSEEASYVYRVYASASVAAAALIASVGAGVAWSYSRPRTSLLTRIIAALYLAALPMQALSRSLPVVRVTTDPFVDTWLRGTLQSLPPNAVLVLSEGGIVADTQLFGFGYLQAVEGLRRDVTVVNDTGERPLYEPVLPPLEGKFPLQMQRRMLLEATRKDESLKGRPLYTTFPVATLRQKYESSATGYVFALDGAPARPAAPSFIAPPDVVASLAASHIMSHLRYLEASRMVETNGNKAATPLLMAAMNLDPLPQSDDYIGFILHRKAVLGVEQ